MATEDNADEFYKPYYYATEDNADLFYAPYYGVAEADTEGDKDKEGDINDDADSYYIPYLPYADKMTDPWPHYYRPLPTHDEGHLFEAPLPTHDRDHLFEAPMPTYDPQYQGPSSDLQELPKLSQGLHQITGPKYDLSHEITQDSDNEIFDVPKILLKSIYYWLIEHRISCITVNKELRCFGRIFEVPRNPNFHTAVSQ